MPNVGPLPCRSVLQVTHALRHQQSLATTLRALLQPLARTVPLAATLQPQCSLGLHCNAALALSCDGSSLLAGHLSGTPHLLHLRCDAMAASCLPADATPGAPAQDACNSHAAAALARMLCEKQKTSVGVAQARPSLHAATKVSAVLDGLC